MIKPSIDPRHLIPDDDNDGADPDVCFPDDLADLEDDDRDPDADLPPDLAALDAAVEAAFGPDPNAPPPPPPDITELVMRFFGADTPLARAPEVGGRPYEERPQQRQMAETIAAALRAGEHLFMEAPTGVGKSFAYLIPAVYWARVTGKPVLISTHTIALQEQLITKDIPVLQKLMDVPFTAALAKGRQNYLCPHRLGNVAGNQDEYLPLDGVAPELERLMRWAEKTEEGSLTDLDFKPTSQLWSAVCSESGVCPRDKPGGHHGQGKAACFFQRARRTLWGADIIIANHALTCIDLATRRESEGKVSILPDYSAMIIDEAHTFEDVAANHLGLRISSFGIQMMFNRLYNPRKHKGLLARAEAGEALELCIRAIDATDNFFARVQQWVSQHREQPVVYTHPGQIPNLLSTLWGDLFEAMRELIRETDGEEDYRNELRHVLSRLVDYRDGIDAFLAMSRESCVYWLELNGRRQNIVVLNAVPIEVHTYLRDDLFHQKFAVVMTSATLAINGKMDYLQKRLGADEARTMTLDSPFDFQKQVELYLPMAESMPSPKDDNFLDGAITQIRHFIELTHGKAFVLFTSYVQMNRVADALQTFFMDLGIRLFVQGGELQRSQMLEAFRDDIDSVIFGTDSFWTGVDVPGEALSNVIIVKLPFPVPSHPLVGARSDLIESQGGNSFRDYFLPEAILKFRQGIGRLIRSRDDHGIIVVLDSRIVRTGYGKAFLNSIPTCTHRIF